MVMGSVGGPERHADGLQRVATAVPVPPVQTRATRLSVAAVVVATVWAEEATVLVPEATGVVSGTINVLVDIVVAVKRRELLIVLDIPKRVSTGVACVATEANTVVVAFIGNLEVAVFGVAVLAFPVKQVDT